jgi:hypothetical protein
MRSKFSISAKAKNLFLLLAESLAQTLNVTSCYVCGAHRSCLMRLPSQNTEKMSGS